MLADVSIDGLVSLVDEIAIGSVGVKAGVSTIGLVGAMTGAFIGALTDTFVLAFVIMSTTEFKVDELIECRTARSAWRT